MVKVEQRPNKGAPEHILDVLSRGNVYDQVLAVAGSTERALLALLTTATAEQRRDIAMYVLGANSTLAALCAAFRLPGIAIEIDAITFAALPAPRSAETNDHKGFLWEKKYLFGGRT